MLLYFILLLNCQRKVKVKFMTDWNFMSFDLVCLEYFSYFQYMFTACWEVTVLIQFWSQQMQDDVHTWRISALTFSCFCFSLMIQITFWFFASREQYVCFYFDHIKSSYLLWCNIGSLEIHTSTYNSAKLKNVPIHTNHSSFQLKWTLEAVKLPQLLFLFTQNLIWRSTVLHNYFRNIMLWIQNNFNMLRDLKTDAFEGQHHISSFICMSFLTQ